MTPKQKAVELIDKYRTYIRIADKYNQNLPSEEIYLAEKCALIAVDEILDAVGTNYSVNYWQEVKQEIELL